MKIEQIKCLGIGSNAFSMLNSVSFLIKQNGDGNILIDCGPTTPQRLYANGIRFVDIDSIVVTHSHMDHVLGLPYMLFGRNLENIPTVKSGKTTKKLQLVCTKNVYDCIFDTLNLLHPGIKLNYEVKHIDIRSSTEIGRLKFASILANHEVETFSTKFIGENITYMYTSDTRPFEGLSEFGCSADVAVIEAMVPHKDIGFAEATKHSTSLEAGIIAKSIGCSNVYLAHLRPSYFNSREELEAEASKAAGFPVRYPDEDEVIFSAID